MRTAAVALALIGVLHADVGSGAPKKKGPFRIAVLRAGDSFDTCAQRLARLLPNDRVQLVELDAKLAGFDVVVLGSGWAEHHWQALSARKNDFAAFVRQGGGLLMFQPNPHRFEGDKLTVDLLPCTFRVDNWYRDQSVKIDAKHDLTRGLENGDMPYPCDQIIEYSKEWIPLARGVETGSASLIVTHLGRGRAAVDSDHHVRDRGTTGWHSDALVRRLVLWLARR